MSLRSFTVFQDVSEDPKPKPPVTKSRITRSSAINAENASVIPITLAVDKENVHPVTGERAGSNSLNKKRKTNVLATKVHVVIETRQKKHSDGTSHPEPKKRKASASGTKTKSSSRKETRSSGSSKKVSKRTIRKVSPLPKLDECDELEKEKERITQAGIDSRCYELTVKPLADVSQAYEETLSIAALPCEDKVKPCLVKDPSVEPEIRDYFDLSHSLSSKSSSTRLRTPSEEPQEGRIFSTPERKQIYSAFTFSSPSPSSERFRKNLNPLTISPFSDLA